MVVRKSRIGIWLWWRRRGSKEIALAWRSAKMAPRSRYAGTGARAGLGGVGRVQPALLEQRQRAAPADGFKGSRDNVRTSLTAR
jgi:hypothetical protein